MKVCPFCKKKIIDEARVCPYCGTHFLNHNYEILPLYYQKMFSQFDNNNGKFKITFNFWAFLFGIFWYFYKGMWAKPLIMIGISLLFSGIPSILFILYCALWGNYDYYQFYTFHKQL